MVIKVLKSKNDQLRKGDEVIFSEIPGPACPVKLLQTYLAHFSIPSSSRDLIFRPISRGKNSFKLVSQDKPISYTTITEAFRKDLRSVGVDPSTFGFHSLRSGGATSAANSGVSDRVFQRHSRWKSVQAKDTYVDDDLEKRLSVSKSLGLQELSFVISPNTLSLYVLLRLVLAKPSQNKLICLYILSVDVVQWSQNMLFLANEPAKKVEINILTARDTTGPGFQAGCTMGSHIGGI